MVFRTLLAAGGFLGAMLGGGCTSGTTPAGDTSARPNPANLIPRITQPEGKNSNLDLFIADVDSNVLIYTANIDQQDPPLLGEITQGVSRSMAVWVDRHGTLYVLNSGGSSVNISEYKRGKSIPFKTITEGLQAPSNIAVDRSGDLYVDETLSSGDVVLVYGKGAQSPTRTVTLPTSAGAGGLAFDPKGDLLVATFDVEHNTGNVYFIAPGSSKARNLNLQSPPGPSLGADRAGYVYVGDPSGTIEIYPAGKRNPVRTIDLNVDGFYTQMDVQPDGTIYWPNYDNESMFEIAPGASGASNVFSTAGSGIGAAVGT